MKIGSFGSVALSVLCLAVGMGGSLGSAAPQAGSQVPVVSSDPAVQRQVEAQLAPVRLDPTVEEAVGSGLKGHGLAFVAMGPKTAFMYADTPDNRAKFTATIRAFPITVADPAMLAQRLNGIVKPTADGFRPTIVTVRDPKTFVVRAIPEQMTVIAKWIADNDK
jgi:hypothetical protein